MTKDIYTEDIIQNRINTIIGKTLKCDQTIVDDIAFVSGAIAVASTKKTIDDKKIAGFIKEFRTYLDYFPRRCSCTEK